MGSCHHGLNILECSLTRAHSVTTSYLQSILAPITNTTNTKESISCSLVSFRDETEVRSQRIFLSSYSGHFLKHPHLSMFATAYRTGLIVHHAGDCGNSGNTG